MNACILYIWPRNYHLTFLLGDAAYNIVLNFGLSEVPLLKGKAKENIKRSQFYKFHKSLLHQDEPIYNKLQIPIWDVNLAHAKHAVSLFF